MSSKDDALLLYACLSYTSHQQQNPSLTVGILASVSRLGGHGFRSTSTIHISQWNAAPSLHAVQYKIQALHICSST
ncbi:hypothetical protein BDV09DRAFT_154452 [Aspergillus tetrazonus]